MSSLTSPKPKILDKTPAQATTIKPPSDPLRHGVTPYNTPADAPPLALGRGKPEVQGRPINAASVIMGRATNHLPATPVNTPSSLHNLSRRIAEKLTMDTPAQAAGDNRIAPSYE